jgi:hypothetical protein
MPLCQVPVETITAGSRTYISHEDLKSFIESHTLRTAKRMIIRRHDVVMVAFALTWS